MPFDRDTFGAHLKRQRERRGVSLDEVAALTKISRSLLAKLERGDLGDWPSGIFRRGFFRGYAAAIGIDADVLMEDFVRLFPDPATELAIAPQLESAPPDPASLRLTLDAAPATKLANVRAALIDLAGILGATVAVAAVTGHAAVVAAVIATIYHTATTMWGRRVLMPVKSVPPVDPVPRTRAEARRAERVRSGHRLRVVEPPVGRSSRAVN